MFDSSSLSSNKDSILSIIRRCIGEPYYENEYGFIYNMDCMRGMSLLPNNIICQTFTSPPYNIGKKYEEILSLDVYIEWCKKWINIIHDITCNNGSLWLNLGYFAVPEKGRAVPIAYYLWNVSNFYMQQEIVWNYGAGVAAKKYLSPRNEKILWLLKNPKDYIFNLDDIRDPNVKYPNQKKHGKLRCNSIGKNPSDVWQIAKVTSGKNRSSAERLEHPAQTPRDLLDRIILAGSNRGDLILDPFMGSGSTFESAIAQKRKFIGFEINQDYCLMARERIEKFLIKNKYENSLLNF